jgi:hypothetical protein
MTYEAAAIAAASGDCAGGVAATARDRRCTRIDGMSMRTGHTS